MSLTIEEQLSALGKKIDKLREEIDALKKNGKPASTTRKSKAGAFKIENVDEALELLNKGEKPCAYIPKKGANKGKVCGIPATMYSNDGGFIKLNDDDTVPQNCWDSLRCEKCKNLGFTKGVAASLITEKLRGTTTLDNHDDVEAISAFIEGQSGNKLGVASPSNAGKEKAPVKDLPEGKPLEDPKDGKCLFAYQLEESGYSIAMEHQVTKKGSPYRNRTPVLKGCSRTELDKDNYADNISEDVPDEVVNEIKKLIGKVKYEKQESSGDKGPSRVPVVDTEESKDVEEEQNSNNDIDDLLNEMEQETDDEE